MKTVLLTGASGDIGGAIQVKFAAQGYNIIAPTRQMMDMQSEQSIKSFLSTMNNEIDVFVHCAGFNEPKSLADLSETDIQKTFQINTLSFYTICQFLSKTFVTKKQGAIVGISSIYGDFSRKGRLAYATSKHALNGMMKTLAIELGPYNVTVNAVSPGFVDTKMTRKNNSAEIIEGFKRKIPLRRLAKIEDIANVVYFLCSAENNYINGQCIVVDGGYSVGGFQE